MDKGIKEEQRRGKSLRRLLEAVFIAALWLVAGPTVWAESTPTPKTGELKPCEECHEEQRAIEHTKHFVKADPRTPAGQGKQCDACHGDTKPHQREPRKPGLIPIAFGKKAPPEVQNEACLTCHARGARIHWQGSPHERTKQACASCHKLHAKRDQVLIPETQAGVCFTCHQDRRAEMYRLSTHPMKTGAVSCSSCHAPHGSAGRAQLVRNSVNDTCYTCHADKRGPFLWEHPSAKDDCTHCHNPHGSNNRPMLKVKMPYLCQQCHMVGGHPSTLYSGSSLPPTGAAFMLGNSCVNCHSKIHGSNHPSSPRLMR